MNCIILGNFRRSFPFRGPDQVSCHLIKQVTEFNEPCDVSCSSAYKVLYDSPIDPWWLIPLYKFKSQSVDSFSGRFFDMPKGTKPAPPQQANLNEFWGKPRPTKVKEAPTASGSGPKKEDVADMQVDEPSHRDPKSSRLSWLPGYHR